MKGELCGLFQGDRQVGGGLAWDLDILMTDVSDSDNVRYKFAKWVLTALSYWLFENADTVTVRLYNEKGYWEGEGQITSPKPAKFDKMIHLPLSIVGEGTLEEKRQS